ncbi:MAG: hypothetical protein Q8865_05490 [Bacillota bacterium]|nr:hypothetical protein [Bacillota bacterium]
MAKIFAPNKDFSGISAGVAFINGAGETSDPYIADWFRARGYRVEEKSKKKIKDAE